MALQLALFLAVSLLLTYTVLAETSEAAAADRLARAVEEVASGARSSREQISALQQRAAASPAVRALLRDTADAAARDAAGAALLAINEGRSDAPGESWDLQARPVLAIGAAAPATVPRPLNRPA